MSRPVTHYLFIPLILIALVSDRASGSGTRVDFMDAFATARGNAFSATADNASAVYYNPAGMTQLDGVQVRGGSFFISLDYEARIGGEVFEMDDGVQALPSLFVTWNAGEENAWPLWFGLGLYAPFGLATDWPSDAPFFALADRSELEFITVAPVVAFRLGKQLSLGFGPTLNRGRITFDQELTGFFYTGTDTSPGLTASLLWAPRPEHRLALVHRRYSALEFEGRLELPVALGVVLPTEATARFPFPESWRVGYAYQPDPRWNLEVNLEWNRWDVLRTVVLENEINPLPFPFNWQSSWFYEFGATRFFENGLHLSAGLAIVEKSVADAAFNPTVPDSDRRFLSAGAGGRGEHWSWDLTLQYGSGSRSVPQTVPAGPGVVFGGEYQTRSLAAQLAFSRAF